MTTRPGEWAQQSWRNRRQHRACNLVRVARKDGFQTLYFTDHDRPIPFEGATYLPVTLIGMSAEQREAALKSGNQEAYGVIDDSYVIMPDLLGDRWRGADVYHVETDWALPLLVIARHHKTIRKMSFTGSQWVATLEAQTQKLTRPAGGRFGGTFTPRCPYKLGGEFCKKSLTGVFKQYGVRVTAVTTPRMQVTTAESTWITPYDDSYSAPLVTGTATAGVTTTNLTDANKVFIVNEHVGREVRILSGVGGSIVHHRTITANTVDTLTFNALPGTFPSGTAYDIASVADDFFRDGEIQWQWSAPVVASTATATITTTTLTDNTQNWTVNEHVGRDVRLLTGAGGAVNDWTVITANTATTLTMSRYNTMPSGTHYDIVGDCANVGVVTPIVGYRSQDRRLDFLLPTPYPIAVGDSGIVTAGCDGLKTTCKTKFNNLLNWAGDSDAPSAGKILDRTFI